MSDGVVIIWCLVAHYIADFWFQTQKQATQKSSKISALLLHVIVYSTIMGIAVLPFGFQCAAKMAAVCAVCHAITDFISSRLAKFQYSRKKFYGPFGFFSIIGFDQFAHQVQIIATVYWIGIL